MRIPELHSSSFIHRELKCSLVDKKQCCNVVARHIYIQSVQKLEHNCTDCIRLPIVLRLFHPEFIYIYIDLHINTYSYVTLYTS